MATPAIIIKENATVDQYLKNYIDEGWNALSSMDVNLNRYTRFTSESEKEVAFDTRYGVQMLNGNRQSFTLRYRTNGTNYSISRADLTYAGLTPTNITNFLGSVSEVELYGTFVDFAYDTSSTSAEQRAFLVRAALAAVISIYACRTQLNDATQTFITTYWSGTTTGVIRHGVKPRPNRPVQTTPGQTPQQIYKIPWHRDSNILLNGQTGFLVTGFYIDRPTTIEDESGGISFARGNRQVRYFPPAKTIVAFVDQEFIHKVIPVKVKNGNNVQANLESHHGFVKRTAVFGAWYTSPAKIAEAGSYPFKTIGPKAKFKNLKLLYLYLREYFRSIEQRLPRGFNIRTANAETVRQIYAYRINALNSMYPNISRELNGPTVANSIIFRVVNNPQGVNTRQKIMNLYSIYTDLHQSFGGTSGPIRFGKPTQRRGGRTQLEPRAANFVGMV